MTKSEMTRIFAALLLAYPNAEVFKGGIEKLSSTIELWTASLHDVDYWTAEYAVLNVCRELKFPPTIAEFRRQAEKVTAAIRQELNGEWTYMLMLLNHEKTPEGIYKKSTRRGKAVIDRMGGPDNLFVTEIHTLANGQKSEFKAYNYKGFEDAYMELARSRRAVPANAREARMLGARKGDTEK